VRPMADCFTFATVLAGSWVADWVALGSRGPIRVSGQLREEAPIPACLCLLAPPSLGLPFSQSPILGSTKSSTIPTHLSLVSHGGDARWTEEEGPDRPGSDRLAAGAVSLARCVNKTFHMHRMP
jgi:hypothetical protein